MPVLPEVLSSDAAQGQDTFLAIKTLTFNARTMLDHERSQPAFYTPGQLQFLDQRLFDMDICFATIQETRLSLELPTFNLKHFQVILNPAVNGKGGLMTLLRRSPALAVRGFNNLSPLVQCVHLSVHNTLVTV
eukprot:899780-Amphidinium_carterae.1